jgi:hypothetical protein
VVAGLAAKSAILRKVQEVSQPDGLLVLVESVIPDSPEFVFDKWGDLHMFALCGGRERPALNSANYLASRSSNVRRLSLRNPYKVSWLAIRADTFEVA